MFNLTDNIKSFFNDLITSILESVFQILSQLIFSHKGLTGFLDDLYLVFIAFGASVMVFILTFKIFQHLQQAAATGAPPQVGLSDIIVRTVVASAMIPILPVILTFIVGDVAYPLGNWMFGKMGTFTANGVMNYLKSGNVGEAIGSGFVFLIVLGFITVAIVAFTIKICVYHADLLVLELLSIWAAISLCSDENNYMSVWWREVLSQVTTIVIQVALMVAIVGILTSGALTWWNFMLLIGMCVLLIRGPSVTRHMWYATGSGRATINAGKAVTRMAMIKGRS